MQKISNEELGRLSAEEARAGGKAPLVIVLDKIRSMNNVGSIFRTSDAYRVEKICLCGFTPVPPHREIQKTALGATESVPWEHFDSTLSCINSLKDAGYTVYCIEQVKNSIMLQDFVPGANNKIAVVLGNEVEGVTQEVVDACDGALELPQFGMKHSLNVAVTAGIVIWELFFKLNKKT